MAGQRKSYSAELKAKVALEAIKGQRTASEIASRFGVHPNLVSQWKRQALEEMPGIFSDRRAQAEAEAEAATAELYEQIGRLKVELDWVKKKSGLSR
jgi:transposase-like protein